MKTGLFDKNNVEINVGDSYVTSYKDVYTVFWKGGAICGGITFDSAAPLCWEVGIEGIILKENLDWIEILKQEL